MNLKLIIKVFLLSITPIGECRVSIPYGIYNGLSPWETFLISFLGNTLMGIAIYFTIDFISRALLSREPLKSYYERFLKRKLRKLKIYPSGLVFSLVIFIGIPLPGTGAFTGAILARVLGLNFKEAFFTITLGVIFASCIVSMLTLFSNIIF
uniref:Ligand-binding protein SH3 n=1 Tax=Dictyoglomus thermophilum TaxID=14 RepID=A0A7C3MIL7_DICTH